MSKTESPKRSRKRPRPGIDCAWPPQMAIGWAAMYTGVHPSTLRRAVADGELVAAGHRGGSGPLVFRREDLDGWMTGGPAPASATEPQPRAATADVADSLDRIRRAAGDKS